MMDMEEKPLLLQPESNDIGGSCVDDHLHQCSTNISCCRCLWRRSGFLEEVKRLCYLGGPMIAVSLSAYMLQVISLVMVGHLGELSLSSAAMAVALSNVFGFSLLLGMVGALETLNGQAYGAEQYNKLGTQTQTSIFCLNLCCVPLSLLWFYAEQFLTLLGQDPVVSHEAAKFMRCMIPSLFAYATLQPLLRYFQTQSLVKPMFVSSVTTFLLHIPLCWVLSFKSGLNNLGAAVAISSSYWVNVVFFVIYIKYSSSCSKTWTPVSMEMFQGIRVFFRFAIPSAVMVCLEWWSFELLILLSGLLPNPKLQTSVLSVCLSTISIIYTIPYGIGSAGSTRVSNELGAGNPRAARLAVYATIILGLTEATIVSASLFASRNVFGYVFSDEEEVVEYVKRMAPLVCLQVILDSIQGTLAGVARGCGWQHMGAYINLGAFYFVGIPIALVLGFWVKLLGVGLWIGIQTGSFVQCLSLAIITSCTNWEKQATEARERIFEGRCSPEIGDF